MLNEIHEQPAAIRRLVTEGRESIASLAEEIKKRDIRYGMIAARGTSDNAATYGKYLLGIVNGIPVGLAAPSMFTLYNAKPKMENTLVIGISQSGKAADAIEYLQRSKEQGALTACITNEAGSEMTKIADHSILCHAGPEKSVAATKTYTTTLAALGLLAAALAGDNQLSERVAGAADQIEQLVASLEEEISCRSARYRYMEQCITLARGISRATAFEAGLKMAETCYVRVNPYSSADFHHGPIAIVSEGMPCFLFAPEGPSLDSMLEIGRKLKERNAELIVVSSSEEALSLATTEFRVPSGIDDMVSPIVYIVVAQLFAQYLAVAKGLDPDHPRGLSKVTITR